MHTLSAPQIILQHREQLDNLYRSVEAFLVASAPVSITSYIVSAGRDQPYLAYLSFRGLENSLHPLVNDPGIPLDILRQTGPLAMAIVKQVGSMHPEWFTITAEAR